MVSLGAGDLRERVHFQQRGTASDGMGGAVPGWTFATMATAWAHLRPLRGSEPVMAARLDGRQPYILTVRSTRALRQVTPAWRVVDARDANRIFAITSPGSDPDGRRAWLEFMVVLGGES